VRDREAVVPGDGRDRGSEQSVTRHSRARPGMRGSRPAPDGPIAALDLGTNNCRLLVARPEGTGFAVLDAFSRAVRLGEGVEGTNMLSDAAQDRALKALRICASKIRQHRVRDVRIVATEACRRALNGRDFVRRVVRETGLAMDIITAEEEARLAVAGCAPLIDPEAEQLLVFDIGGGSTELIWVDMSGTPAIRRESLIRALAPLGRGRYETATARAAAAHISDWISIPMGVSTLHDRFADTSDDARRFAMMSRHFEERLAPFAPYGAADPSTLVRKLQIIGVSGTATTFGALHLGLRTYDRARVDGLWLGAARAAELADRLLVMAARDRAGHPGIGRGRSDLVVCGSAILLTILRLWPVARFRIADRGLREGILYGLIQSRRDREL
jgi:exopolyphosphatase / guanosine-5'-triphosphate,3'-diphosphate pyrophosphatase